MSFSRDVKTEICANQLGDCCAKAFISAIIRMNSTLTLNNQGASINISFENVSIIKYIYELLKRVYQVETQIIVSKQMKLKKVNIYTLKIVDQAFDILSDLKLVENFVFLKTIPEEYFNDDCCKKAYIAGSFVAAGSVNSPDTTKYHLEISSSEKEHLQQLHKLIKTLNQGKYSLQINFKMMKRRKNYVLYLKSSREIVDFLNYVGATQCTFKFEDIRVQRDFLNSINRMNNMDLANEVKVQKAASQQLAAIKLIDEKLGLDQLDDKLKLVATLRLENPELSLLELCNLYNNISNDQISKSGMNHRLRKLKEIAEQIQIKS